MNIKSVNSIIKRSAEITIVFDDDTKSVHNLTEGSKVTITYLSDNVIVSKTGVIKNIESCFGREDCYDICMMNTIKIELDCSTEYNSDVISIYDKSIRDIVEVVDTPVTPTEPTV